MMRARKLSSVEKDLPFAVARCPPSIARRDLVPAGQRRNARNLLGQRVGVALDRIAALHDLGVAAAIEAKLGAIGNMKIKR
jgi:hypothetical protein